MVSKNTIIAFLLLSATVFATILFMQLTMTPQPALASNFVRASGLTVVTAGVKDGEDYLWIFNSRLGEVVVYSGERGAGIEVMASAKLAPAFDRKFEKPRDRRKKSKKK